MISVLRVSVVKDSRLKFKLNICKINGVITQKRFLEKLDGDCHVAAILIFFI